MISVKGLRKSFGDIVAISDVSFGFDRGEIVALLGGNGSGKSTSINIMTGLMIPDAGSVDVQGFDPFKNPIEAKQKLGVFPDKAGLYPNMTVREHLKFFARLQGIKGKALTNAIDRTVDMLDMEDIIDRRTKGFSHGQTVKTALARAMVHGPDYLVLDEPTRGLDVYAVRQFRHLLRRLRDKGTGILFSSHVMQEVSLLANRVAIIAGGKVCAEDTPEALIHETGTDNLEDAFMVKVGLA
jgi:sodium transport system ATP-binding protein